VRIARVLKTGKPDKEGNGMSLGKSIITFCWLLLTTGCAYEHPHVDRALMAEGGALERNEGVAERYKVSCPDRMEVDVAGRPDLSGRAAVRPDGRIRLGKSPSVLVEGLTPEEVAASMAEQLGLPPDRIKVRVAEFNSREIYLSGPGVGTPRTIPYRGPETVLDVLQRVGGITPAAAPEEVYVVRSHVADGNRPEVFHVELRAIVLKKDDKTNVRVQPFDQVYVGETRQGKTEKCLPPWLRPVYEAFWGIGPPARDP
jgi:protein involved in polysaccharide export with SLBB domain